MNSELRFTHRYGRLPLQDAATGRHTFNVPDPSDHGHWMKKGGGGAVSATTKGGGHIAVQRESSGAGGVGGGGAGGKGGRASYHLQHTDAHGTMVHEEHGMSLARVNDYAGMKAGIKGKLTGAHFQSPEERAATQARTKGAAEANGAAKGAASEPGRIARSAAGAAKGPSEASKSASAHPTKAEARNARVIAALDQVEHELRAKANDQRAIATASQVHAANQATVRSAIEAHRAAATSAEAQGRTTDAVALHIAANRLESRLNDPLATATDAASLRHSTAQETLRQAQNAYALNRSSANRAAVRVATEAETTARSHFADAQHAEASHAELARQKQEDTQRALVKRDAEDSANFARGVGSSAGAVAGFAAGLPLAPATFGLSPFVGAAIGAAGGGAIAGRAARAAATKIANALDRRNANKAKSGQFSESASLRFAGTYGRMVPLRRGHAAGGVSRS